MTSQRASSFVEDEKLAANWLRAEAVARSIVSRVTSGATLVDGHSPEDFVQDAIVSLLSTRKWPVDGDVSIALLSRVVRNSIYNALRRPRPMNLSGANELVSDLEPNDERAEVMGVINTCFRGDLFAKRYCMALAESEDVKPRAIAKQLDVSPATIYKARVRVRRRLGALSRNAALQSSSTITARSATEYLVALGGA